MNAAVATAAVSWGRLPLVLAALVLASASHAQAAAPQARPGHVRARQAVEEVLSSREFAHLNSQRPSWGERVRRWLAGASRWFASFLQRLPAWLWWTVLVWLVLALLAILAHLVYSLVIVLAPPGKRARPGAGLSVRQRLIAGELDFDAAYAHARERMEAQDWSEAVRFLFVSGLLVLQQAGVLAAHPSKTDGDYLRELAGRPRYHEALLSLARPFEAAIYGGAPVGAEQARAMAQVVEGLAHETTVAAAQ